MLAWLAENIGTILIAAVLFAVCAAIAVKLRKDHRQGRSACGGNCAHCAMHGKCH